MKITELVNYIASNGGEVELPDGTKFHVTKVEPANPFDTPDMIGKWVRCTNADKGWNENVQINTWHKVLGEEKKFGIGLDFGNYWGKYSFFDLTNALDYNPEELVGKWYEGMKIENIQIDALGIPSYKLVPSPNTVLEYTYMLCKDIDLSKVTDAPPTKSLKWEDVVKEVKPLWYIDAGGGLIETTTGAIDPNQVPTKSDAKSVLAYCQLLVVMKAANGDWVAGEDEISYSVEFNRESNKLEVVESGVYNPLVNFRTRELAEQALNDNEQLFKDFYQRQ